MHLGVSDLFRAKWSDDIHEEWIRSVLRSRPDLRREQLDRTRRLMDAHVRDGLVHGYEKLIHSLELPDPDDRHVLAAAIRAQADFILTFNLKDFPDSILLSHGIRAVHPDEFLSMLLDAQLPLACEAVRRHRQSLRNPPKSIDEYLGVLEKQHLPKTVAKLRDTTELI